MTEWISFLNVISFKQIIWIVPVVALLHELEEWNILRWYEENYTNLPETSNLSIRTWLIGISIVMFAIAFVAYIIPFRSISAALVLLLVLFTISNGLQHAYWLIYFKKYAPGVVFAAVFGIPVGLYVAHRIITQSLLPWWLVAALSLLMIPELVETVKCGNRMTKSIRRIHELSLRISNRLWGGHAKGS